MVLEEVALYIRRLLDWFGRVDITLATGYHGNIAQAQRNDVTRKEIDDSTVLAFLRSSGSASSAKWQNSNRYPH